MHGAVRLKEMWGLPGGGRARRQSQAASFEGPQPNTRAPDLGQAVVAPPAGSCRAYRGVESPCPGGSGACLAGRSGNIVTITTIATTALNRAIPTSHVGPSRVSCQPGDVRRGSVIPR